VTVILSLLELLFGWALKAWRARGPAPIVVEATAVGQLQTALKTEETANAQVAKAIAAGDAADALAVRDPGGLRAPDPDSRE
jgi:hypothetical protein